MAIRRPTKDELERARGNRVPDVMAPGLRVLFCGINPGLYSAAVGHHFARPGNRFWPALHAAGLTPRVLDPSEEQTLLTWGYGITNIAPRATVAASELTATELTAGMPVLVDKVLHYRPRILAILGVSAYRATFARPQAVLGCQEEQIGDTRLWVLPNPSGLNAHFQLDDLARWYGLVNEA